MTSPTAWPPPFSRPAATRRQAAEPAAVGGRSRRVEYSSSGLACGDSAVASCIGPTSAGDVEKRCEPARVEATSRVSLSLAVVGKLQGGSCRQRSLMSEVARRTWPLISVDEMRP